LDGGRGEEGATMDASSLPLLIGILGIAAVIGHVLLILLGVRPFNSHARGRERIDTEGNGTTADKATKRAAKGAESND
jgi:hypothetical protein